MVRLNKVALRKESVDRKSTYVIRLPRAQVSLSVRRAWIEKHTILGGFQNVAVALRKESVDRKIFIIFGCLPVSGRSP